MNLKDTYNKIAEAWVTDHNADTWWQEGTDAFLKIIPVGCSVLDVGCGGGIKSKYIAEREFKVTGIDFSEKMIEIAQRENPNLDFAVVDVYNIDQYPKTFDAIFAQAVLLHIPKKDVMEVLQKMVNRLNFGGFLYLGVKAVKDDGVEEKVVTEDDYGYAYDRFFSFFTLSELKNYFRQLELDIVWEGEVGSGRANWVQIVGKKR